MADKEIQEALLKVVDGLPELIISGQVHMIVVAIDIKGGVGTVIKAMPCPDAEHFKDFVDRITHALHAAVEITSGQHVEEPGIPPGTTPH